MSLLTDAATEAVYPLLPVIYETAHKSGIRPERPMAIATIDRTGPTRQGQEAPCSPSHLI